MLSPAKPKKAKDIHPAMMNAMGAPIMALGTFANSSFSRMPAMRTSARVKPIPEVKPLTMLWMKLYSVSMFRRATPSTAQFVVMRGR